MNEERQNKRYLSSINNLSGPYKKNIKFKSKNPEILVFIPLDLYPEFQECPLTQLFNITRNIFIPPTETGRLKINP